MEIIIKSVISFQFNPRLKLTTSFSLLQLFFKLKCLAKRRYCTRREKFDLDINFYVPWFRFKDILSNMFFKTPLPLAQNDLETCSAMIYKFLTHPRCRPQSLRFTPLRPRKIIIINPGPRSDRAITVNLSNPVHPVPPSCAHIYYVFTAYVRTSECTEAVYIISVVRFPGK